MSNKEQPVMPLEGKPCHRHGPKHCGKHGHRHCIPCHDGHCGDQPAIMPPKPVGVNQVSGGAAEENEMPEKGILVPTVPEELKKEKKEEDLS